MKKRILYALAIVALLCTWKMNTYAEPLQGSKDWYVEFTADQKMNSNFSSAVFDDVLDGMQPGDSAFFQIKIKNSYQTETNWYMTNAVLKSLEDASQTAKGGAYSYILTYIDANGGVKTLYNSEEVGGESYQKDLEGLHEATDALKDFFYLDTIPSKKSSQVNLYVLLDGETQGNDYQDTLAQLQMNFAVELPTITKEERPTIHEKIEYVENHIVKTEENSVTNTWNLVKTGDDTNLGLLYGAAFVIGLLFVVLCVICLRCQKQLKGGRK